MKKILLTALLITTLSKAQEIHFGRDTYTNISLTVEPKATLKENSPNLTFEFELVSNWVYVKPSVQILPSISYTDFTAGIGLNLEKGFDRQWRYYGGIRLGYITRGSGKYYPLFGWEAGVDKKITDDFYIGLRGTLDWREDFEFSGSSAKYQFNGGIRFTYIL